MAETEADHQSQSCDPDIAKETEMVENLKKLFGIAPAEAMSALLKTGFS